MYDRVLLADGAMGTMLYAKGVYLNACFDELNFRGPAVVREVHREYIRAGADIIETNTFGANRFKLRKHGLEDRTIEINREGARLAREEAGEGVYIAGSIGPLGLPIVPWGAVSAKEAEDAFTEQATGLWEGGVDLFILETFGDLSEIRRAIAAVRRVAGAVPIVAQMTIDENEESHSETIIDDLTRNLDLWGADVVGLNCSVGPAAMLEALEKMTAATAKPISVMPNAGMPRAVDGRNIYLSSPEYLAEYTKRFILSGAKLIGGCCGTTPAHIKAMRAAIRALQPPSRAMVVLPKKSIEIRTQERLSMGAKSAFGRKLEEGEFVLSVEIVPPRGFDASAAIAAARRLRDAGVDCINIPDGPRASARMSGLALGVILQREAGIEALLHYTCRDRNLLGMQSDLLGLQAQGVRNLLLITGDPPKLGDYPDATAVYDVDSIGLTNMVAALNAGMDISGKPLGRSAGFLIGVGANPGAINLDLEVARFEAKVAAGAEFAITQPVFDVRLLEAFLKRIEAVRLPILAGLWPLSSLRNAEFMHNEVPGASVPEEVMERMQRAQDRGPDFARDEGVAIARETLAAVRGLVQGVQLSPPFGRIESALQVLAGI